MKKTFAVLLVLTIALGLVWFGCDMEPTRVTEPATEIEQAAKPAVVGIERAIAVQNQHTPRLMAIPGVVGTATGLDADGNPVVKVFAMQFGVTGIPKSLDGVPVAIEVTGMFVALSDPTARFDRPVPIGVSTGHPDITAGTIGARVTDGTNVYALSNNHVYANSNKATIGDNVLQPGPYDGGQDPEDAIGTLAYFEPIMFNGPDNKIDAAIALSSTGYLGNATLSDGYGTPSSTIIVSASIGQTVQKYGRTTLLTKGQVSEINVTVDVCYKTAGPFRCKEWARFVEQIAISDGSFSSGGDSGSLIVTDDGNNYPVGLLFAGSDTRTIANQIDLVLDRFNVTIDDAEAPPEEPLTDIAVTGVSAPASVVQGAVVDVSVTVKNVGNQDVTSDISVTLKDDTDGVTVGTQTITGGLTAGASTILTFSWNTDSASLGDHTLTASHDFADDNPVNNSNYTTVTVNEAGTGPVVDACDPNNGNTGKRLTVAVTGSNFQDGATVDFGGNGIIVQGVSFVGPNHLDVKINIQRKAATGSRVVTVTNPDGQVGTLTAGFTVNP